MAHELQTPRIVSVRHTGKLLSGPELLLHQDCVCVCSWNVVFDSGITCSFESVCLWL